MKTPALLSVALLLLLLVSVVPTISFDQTPITIQVTNAVTPSQNQTYSTYVVKDGILIGGLRRLQNTSSCFTFTYREDPNFGPYLDSVNGLAENDKDQTYWELLVKPQDGEIIWLDVGIGCYIPDKYDMIILRYAKIKY